MRFANIIESKQCLDQHHRSMLTSRLYKIINYLNKQALAKNMQEVMHRGKESMHIQSSLLLPIRCYKGY